MLYVARLRCFSEKRPWSHPSGSCHFGFNQAVDSKSLENYGVSGQKMWRFQILILKCPLLLRIMHQLLLPPVQCADLGLWKQEFTPKGPPRLPERPMLRKNYKDWDRTYRSDGSQRIPLAQQGAFQYLKLQDGYWRQASGLGRGASLKARKRTWSAQLYEVRRACWQLQDHSEIG